MANNTSLSSSSEPEFHSSGQLQTQRALPALQSNAFNIEQRSFADWISYLRTIAGRISFYDTNSGQAEGNWQAALPNDVQARALESLMSGSAVTDDILALASRADITALMACYQMLRYPVAQTQRFTRRHLDYYYQDVLGFRTNPATADRAHLVLTLAPDTPSVTLLKGTRFKGGQDSAGNNLIYQTNNNALFNQAKIAQLFTLSRLTDAGQLLLTEGINVDQDAEMLEEGIFTFGEAAQPAESEDSQSQSTELLERQSQPRLGFELASSCLHLAGGQRSITVTFVRKGQSPELPVPLAELFDVAITTADGLLELTDEVTDVAWQWQDNALTITCEPQFAAITGIDGELPFLKLLIKPEWLQENEPDASAALLHDKLFADIRLHVSVTGLPGLVIGHGGNALDASAPFQPFGARPAVASRFDFTHPELLCKSISNASLNLSWLSRPDDWNKHYYAYRDYADPDHEYSGDPTVDDFPSWPSYTTTVFRSDLEDPVPFDPLPPLFSTESPVDNIDRHSLVFINTELSAVQSYEQLPLTSTRPRLWPRYFSLQLNSPDFGHKDFSLVSQYAAQLNARHFNDSDYQPLMVQQPYTPQLDRLTLNYDSSVSLTDDTGQLLMRHVLPLGRPVISQVNNGLALLPYFDQRGYLYISIGQLKLPTQLRVYFQLDPVDGSNITDYPLIDFQYLSDSGWQYFDSSLSNSASIIEDSTYQLLDSGIITFDLPALDYHNNFIDPQRFWIRVSIANNAVEDGSNHARYSRIRDIYAQGLEVELASDTVAADHYTQPLAAGTINALTEAQAAVAEVAQPYPSFAAKPAETATTMQVRASERLRHKQRALLAWDYERLVLGKFPELYLARCIATDTSDTSDNGDTTDSGENPDTSDTFDFSTGFPVTMVVVPANHNPEILQPKIPLYLKRQIQRFIDSVSPDEVTPIVQDPIYEEVTITLVAQIYDDFDIERVQGELNELLVNTMTPWNQAASATTLQHTIQLTYLAQRLEQHEAVESIYVMRANQTTATGIKRYPNTDNGDSISTNSGTDMTGLNQNYQADNIITSSRYDAILVPARTHNITLFNNYQNVFEGIEKWRIEVDFRVG
ncbi:hypothetical protein [Gynuella sunshinyii]|uniref:Baseplate protein J-like domain-containing protein n=1 Tax=Gynuella sunshinyii YC6258 TaxID=1445510 RepID=A0A0C5VV27_9GAMM|nr:hypothetical protein [Gynuella sunshinyii]AJQ94234.1 hypothetical Protein YC6258_02196 [Gynuella sunshinyii YC6258]